MGPGHQGTPLADDAARPVYPRGVSPAPTPTETRVDRWIWAVRLTKTRTEGAAACRGGHVRVNGVKAKPSTVVVRSILLKRVGAAPAAEAFEDHTPPPPPQEERPAEVVRDRGAGRPTKRERRQIERLRGY